MRRHEIPTHLDVADRAFAGLTVRQLLTLAAGLALAYGAASDLPLPLAPRLGLAAAALVVTVLIAVWHPGGRPAEEWAFVLLRYASIPRVAVWRPRECELDDAEPREVVLPGPTRPTDARAEADHGA